MLTPFPDGRLESRSDVSLPVSSSRLQATFSGSGIEHIAVWGNGEVGSLHFLEPVPEGARVKVRPGLFRAEWGEGSLSIRCIPSSPAIVLDFEGSWFKGVRLVPGTVRYLGIDPAVSRTAMADGLMFSMELGSLAVRWVGSSVRGSTLRAGVPSDGREALSRSLLIFAGSAAEVEALLSGADIDALRRDCDETLDWLSTRFVSGDPVLGSLFSHCLSAAVSSVKRNEKGDFAGLSAGNGYSLPARTYYRDGYWTIQALLPFRPGIVRLEVLALARGAHDDGECPSGVIFSSPVGVKHWEARRTATEESRRENRITSDWWSDHFDSPLYLVLMAFDYLEWTGDSSILDEDVGGRSLRSLVALIFDRYDSLCGPEGAPLKPFHERDWADNVFRSGLVTYDLGLYHGALMAAAREASGRDPASAAAWTRRAASVARVVRERLWRKDGRHLVEMETPEGYREEHLALDTLAAVRFGAVDAAEGKRILSSCSAVLETRNNKSQPYGDWGVMCAFPAYGKGTRTKQKSSFPYRYHNGSDWPFLDGIYAQLLMEAGDGEWRYPLSRWWEYGLAQGWPEPVEFYSPPYGKGSPLQGWSSMPAAAMVMGGFGLGPGRTPRLPPWGESELRGCEIGGKPVDLAARGNRLLTSSPR
jgi:hypothetical protein